MDHIELFEAAGTGEAVKLIALIDGGADPNWVAPKVGHTPLYNACVCNQPHIVRALLERGADPNFRMNYHSPVDGRTERCVVALMFARSPDVVAALIEGGADVNISDEKGLTSLIRAAHWGKLQIVEALLDAGADATLKTNDGRNARDVAAVRMEYYRSLPAAGNNDAVTRMIKTFDEILRLVESRTSAG